MGEPAPGVMTGGDLRVIAVGALTRSWPSGTALAGRARHDAGTARLPWGLCETVLGTPWGTASRESTVAALASSRQDRNPTEAAP